MPELKNLSRLQRPQGRRASIGEKRERRRGQSICIRERTDIVFQIGDPRDRVIRIEMNVNPLNTIPGQNTATRGSESGQIRYRGGTGPLRSRRM